MPLQRIKCKSCGASAGWVTVKNLEQKISSGWIIFIPYALNDPIHVECPSCHGRSLADARQACVDGRQRYEDEDRLAKGLIKK